MEKRKIILSLLFLISVLLFSNLVLASDAKELALKLNRLELLDGDVNADGKVDIFDLASIGLYYGTKESDANWNWKADVANSVGEIDIFDLAEVGLNYGKNYNSVINDPVFVSPSSKDVIVGEDFSININISTPASVFAVDFTLTFNPIILNATSVDEGDFLKKDGASTFKVVNINNTEGKINFANTRFGVGTGISGDGSLAKINFKALKVGTSDLKFIKFTAVDATPIEIPGIAAENGTVNVKGEELCIIDEECDDGLYCNGAEKCVAGFCQAGISPDCNDGVGCTDDSCNEYTDSCDNIPNYTNCDDGLWCNGAETCNALLDCQAGTPPVIDDGVVCTDDSCDEVKDIIVNAPNDGNCDDGLFCNGKEYCDVKLDCQAGTSIECSPFNILKITTCFNSPDANPFTWDFREVFTSVCDEGYDKCTVGDKTITHTCSVDNCGAECDVKHECVGNDCSETYYDYCEGKKLVEYDNNKVKDLTIVEDFCENFCQEDCICIDCTVDCSAPSTNTYCVKGVCGAECDQNSDCQATECDYLDGCVGSDYYDYNDMSNNCLDCSCESNVCGSPIVYYDDQRCPARIYLKKGEQIFSLPRNEQVSFNELESNCGLENLHICSKPFAYYKPTDNLNISNYFCLDADDILHPGQGYFIQVEQDCYFEMDGEKFSQDKIGYLGSGKLGKGWNLMGSVSVEEVFDKGTCSLYGGVGPIKYVYNVNSCQNVKYYNNVYKDCREEYGVWRCGCSVDILEPGLGYWIRTANDCSLG